VLALAVGVSVKPVDRRRITSALREVSLSAGEARATISGPDERSEYMSAYRPALPTPLSRTKVLRASLPGEGVWCLLVLLLAQV
jgi:hypothetical protein